MSQLNNSHVDPIFILLKEFEISYLWGSLEFLYRTDQFCTEPAGLEKTRQFYMEPDGSALKPADFVWKRPKTVWVRDLTRWSL